MGWNTELKMMTMENICYFLIFEISTVCEQEFSVWIFESVMLKVQPLPFRNLFKPTIFLCSKERKKLAPMNAI